MNDKLIEIGNDSSLLNSRNLKETHKESYFSDFSHSGESKGRDSGVMYRGNGTRHAIQTSFFPPSLPLKSKKISKAEKKYIYMCVLIKIQYIRQHEIL